MFSIRTILLGLVCGGWLLACGTSGKKADVADKVSTHEEAAVPTLGKAWVVLTTEAGEHRVNVEIARTNSERSRGLMFRKELRSGDGMLFIFDQEANQTFWMKNTLIPLDMIFIRRDKTIAGIVHEATPLTLTQRSVGKPSLYVLEVPGGWAKANGVESGQSVRFQGVN